MSQKIHGILLHMHILWIQPSTRLKFFPQAKGKDFTGVYVALSLSYFQFFNVSDLGTRLVCMYMYMYMLGIMHTHGH